MKIIFGVAPILGVMAFLAVYTSFFTGVNAQFERDPSIKIKEPFYKDLAFFPDEVTQKYSHYISLADLEENKCNLLSFFESYPKSIMSKIEEKKCVPDSHTFQAILEEGYLEDAKTLIKAVYLKNEVDPSNEIKSWVGKKESRIKYIGNLIQPPTSSRITPNFSFYNYDNFVKLILKLSNNFQSERITVLCHRDLLIVKGNFFLSNKTFALSEKKKLFDEVEGECEFNYNSFNSELEITFRKKNKMKMWETLFAKA